MKRSQVNHALGWAVQLLDNYQIKLPRFATRTPQQWRENLQELDVIRSVMLGWDITDFGSGDFENTGAVLFTVRNGLLDNSKGTPYAEKYILLKDGQGLPTHYHAEKTEDIINRGGGLLSLRFYNKTPDGSLDMHSDVKVYSDGIPIYLKAGEECIVEPGNSVTITPYLYHNFSAKPGSGDLIVGEISSVNDDKTDNYFAEPTSRFSQIQEDEAPLYLLCNEYEQLN